MCARARKRARSCMGRGLRTRQFTGASTAVRPGPHPPAAAAGCGLQTRTPKPAGAPLWISPLRFQSQLALHLPPCSPVAKARRALLAESVIFVYLPTAQHQTHYKCAAMLCSQATRGRMLQTVSPTCETCCSCLVSVIHRPATFTAHQKDSLRPSIAQSSAQSDVAAHSP